MTDVATWEKANDEYLAAAMNWLRLRLARQSAREQKPVLLPPPPVEQTTTETSRRWFLRRQTREQMPPSMRTLLPPAPIDFVTDEQVDAAAAAMANAEKVDPPPALLIAAERFGLSVFERNVLLLCIGMELDPALGGLCARANDDPDRPYPTFALALSLFDQPAWDALSPERPLRYWRLIEINQPGAQALTASQIRADERIVNYTKGLNYLDDRLSPFILPLLEAGEQNLPASQQQIVDEIAARVRAAAPGPLPVMNLLGSDSRSKQLVARAASAALELHLYRIPAQLLPAAAGDLETLARLWQRDTILLPITLYVDAHDSDLTMRAEGSNGLSLQRFLARMRSFLFISTRDPLSGLTQTTLRFDVSKPTPQEQRAAWVSALAPSESDATANALTGQFNLNLTTIDQIARLAKEVGDPADIDQRVWDACLAHSRPNLESLARRLAPKATLDDVILPETEKSLLLEIAEQVGQRTRVYQEWGFADKMNRGLGIGALFTGDSGTGKTMAAEAIANNLRLDLYRVDLSAVVSKYIGETEKNLRQLFDAAEDGGAILFFDEADALFGKRSEVKDSHDRYANIEINYLLQRIEAYGGLAILATNMKEALDPAFIRRLRFIVNFPYPAADERRAIWRGIFPPQVELGEIDFERLARLDLTGGNIQNVALNAAFLAAKSNSKVTMPLILAAARSEFRKLGRFINEADFVWKETKETAPTKTTPVGFAGVTGGVEGIQDDSLGAVS